MVIICTSSGNWFPLLVHSSAVVVTKLSVVTTLFPTKMIYISEGKLWSLHFLGRRSNHVTSLSTSNESGEYLILFFYLFSFTSWYLNIGDNVHLKCKGRVKYDTLENAITLDFCLFDSKFVIKPRLIFVRAILAPI